MNIKQLLRKEILAKRRRINAKQYDKANHIIVQKSIELVEQLNLNSKTIGIYWPITGEVDLLHNFTTQFNQLALPVLSDNNIFFTKYNLGDELEQMQGTKIYQPKFRDQVIPDIIFIPALALCTNGYRLGFGKGHYDKYLTTTKISKAITVGVTFHDNLLLSFPIHKGDYKLDYIITDQILIKT